VNPGLVHASERGGTLRKRSIGIVLATALASLGLVAVSGTSAQADTFESSSFFCSGPYTQGMGTSDAGAGSVVHKSGYGGTYTVRGQWYNSARTTRTSYYHGAGWQTFRIETGAGTLYGQNKGCHFIG
jgi:hypothetical protein